MKNSFLMLLLKRMIPLNVKKLVRYPFDYHKTSYPYKILEPDLFNGINFSDAFLFRMDTFETQFMAENSLALLVASKVPCTHTFIFLTTTGKVINRHQIVSEEFHYQLKITESIVGGEKIGSFIHQTAYKDDDIKRYKKILGNHIFMHRGYTGYRKLTTFSEGIYSYLHGNFGALYVDQGNRISSLARKEREYIYTPQIAIVPSKCYELFFLNPTDRPIQIIVRLIRNDGSSYKDGDGVAEPFGIFKYSLDQDHPNVKNICWESDLALCRAIIFEDNGKQYDVFHT